MLDQLLGRAALKERIDELESEVASLEEQLAAERERRSDAVSDRQDAQESVNRLEDRIADLKGQLERAREGERVVEFRDTTELRVGRVETIIDRLQSLRAGEEGALTAMVDGSTPEAVQEVLGERAALVNRTEPCLVCVDDEGLLAVALDPPLPPEPFLQWDDSFHLDPSWFLPRGDFDLALVRSDLFAVGSSEDGELVDVEGFKSDLKADHSKGGYSQGRFERGRDEQIDEHLDRCRSVLDGRDAERLVVVGERTVIHEFRDIAIRTATVDATGEPTAALDAAFDSFWRTTVSIL